MAGELDYTNKNILAPMVRIGTLPTRLLALDYGADLVYSEEIIDHRMLKCTRTENALLDTVDYTMKDGTITFRTCSKEKSRVVFQMGTCNAQRALKVAKLVEKDVAAVDINMGCPKEFSLKGGMGAALLTQPQKVKEILTTLVQNLTIPVTCKIRILPTPEETIALAKLIESTGVAALAIHGRFKEERPRHDIHNDYIKAVAQELSITVIANGGSKEISSFADIAKFKEDSGCCSVMLARAAQWNPSIFRAEGLLPIDTVIHQYLKYAVQYDNDWSNTKYCMQQMLHKELDCDRGRLFHATRLMSQICEIFHMEDFYEKSIEARDRKQSELIKSQHNTPLFSCRTTDDGREVIEMPFVYSGKEYSSIKTPKLIVNNHCMQNKIGKAVYSHTLDADNMYTCIVTVANQHFSSSYSDLSKKCGEQAAAVVYLRYHKMDDGRMVKSEDNRNHIAMRGTKYQLQDKCDGEKNSSDGCGDNNQQLDQDDCVEVGINCEQVNKREDSEKQKSERVENESSSEGDYKQFGRNNYCGLSAKSTQSGDVNIGGDLDKHITDISGDTDNDLVDCGAQIVNKRVVDNDCGATNGNVVNTKKLKLVDNNS